MRVFSRFTAVTLAMVLAFAFQAVFAPGTAVAKWSDNSDDLPGTGTNVAPYLVVGGLLVAGLVVYKVAKGKSGGEADKPTQTPAKSDTPEAASDTAAEQASVTETAELSPLARKPADAGLKLQFGLDPHLSNRDVDAGDWALSDVEVKVGVSLGF